MNAGGSGGEGSDNEDGQGEQSSGGTGTGGATTNPTETIPCPSFSPATSLGTVTDSALTEVSGIVESSGTPGVLWVHNDSGDSARVFALDATGKLLTTVNLTGAAATDWEDIALGPGPEESVDYLYLADIGDNAYARPSVTVYRVPEPAFDPESAPASLVQAGVAAINLSYPDGAENAETLLIDPWTGDLYIVSKTTGGVSTVYRAVAPLSTTSTTTLEVVATLTFGQGDLPGSDLTTGGDISRDGNYLGIRTYSHAFVWVRQDGETLSSALSGAPCATNLIYEVQGESLGFAADSSGYFSLSEQGNQSLNFFSVN
jgi:hypothetical protein